MSFKIGDKVKWTSQASGFKKEKQGVIHHIIKPGEVPTRHEIYSVINPVRSDGSLQYSDAFGGGYSRFKESYIVAVPAKTPRGKATLYWPKEDKLQRA